MSSGFLGCGAVIDNPDLVELRTAESDLVQVGVVSHRVDVHPVRINGRAFHFLLWNVLGRAFGGIGLRRHRLHSRVVFALNIVQIDPFRVVGHFAVIGLGPVTVLDEVIPASPFPDDFTGLRACGPDLDQAIRLQMRLFHRLSSAALGEGFLFVDHLPTDEQRVAVGQFDGVVVRHSFFAMILQIPNQIAVPVEFL
jgi:hypothetical protein